MKNKILYTIIFMLIATFIIGIFIVTNNFYSRVAMITEINEENNLIMVTCSNGNTFEIYEAIEDWTVGDLCSLIMYDNGTELVNDDKIISMRYGGYIELYKRIEETIK